MQGKMAANSSMDGCMTWIGDEQVGFFILTELENNSDERDRFLMFYMQSDCTRISCFHCRVNFGFKYPLSHIICT